MAHMNNNFQNKLYGCQGKFWKSHKVWFVCYNKKVVNDLEKSMLYTPRGRI